MGIVGPYNSYCAEVEIPIVNRASGGAIAMISPANTGTGLTRDGPGVARGQPEKHYPTGVRNYARLTAPDDFQGAGDAMLARQLGLKSVYVLRATEAGGYGLSLAAGFGRAAPRLHLRIAGSSTWDSNTNYAALAEKVGRSGAEGVFLAGFPDGELLKALRARLGRRVTLIGGDLFLPISDTLKAAGPAALGMYVSFAGVPNEKLGPVGRPFLRRFGATQPGGATQSGTYVPQAAQAAEMLLQAIAQSDGRARPSCRSCNGSR